MSGKSLGRGTLVWGSLFTLIGGAFLAQAWGVWQVRADVLVPLLLIVAGSVLVVSGAGHRSPSP
jgi:hypothetical protein